jgi:hypothetical protein
MHGREILGLNRGEQVGGRKKWWKRKYLMMLIETKCVKQGGYNYRIIKGTLA